ncbi:CinA family protein [Myceligenerans xiligouense]|uniref:Nicotinamide-nucleotide amidase n=1 Tax=Myceligenerans xiligouense TaxID=253184 RepID=A0A3N4ZMF0_9MICO|nr:CinA family protein [Myceligenerans xiligouense]RPF22095.1 nicotinamide-nucleotide amidase [Myceligenerans xiligouense]
MSGQEVSGHDASGPGAGASGTARAAHPEDLARRLLGRLGARGWTLGVAESLTGGGVTSVLVSVPGASAVLRGGVVAYATDLKSGLLGVDGGLLAARGAVDPDVASQMAAGVRRATGADVGLATTGVAGPDPQDGQAPGRVYVAVSAPGTDRVRRIDLTGTRPDIIAGATSGVLRLALSVIPELSSSVAQG